MKARLIFLELRHALPQVYFAQEQYNGNPIPSLGPMIKDTFELLEKAQQDFETSKLRFLQYADELKKMLKTYSKFFPSADMTAACAKCNHYRRRLVAMALKSE